MSAIIICIIAVFQITFAFINKTENAASSFVFKVFPFFSGMYLLGYSLKLMEVI